MAIGDFNLPKWGDANDPIRKPFTKRGLKRPSHATRIATAIATASDYDQIFCLRGLVSRISDSGVFDYDGAIFKDLCEDRGIASFRSYPRYYLSDHRPISSEIDCVT